MPDLRRASCVAHPHPRRTGRRVHCERRRCARLGVREMWGGGAVARDPGGLPAPRRCSRTSGGESRRRRRHQVCTQGAGLGPGAPCEAVGRCAGDPKSLGDGRHPHAARNTARARAVESPCFLLLVFIVASISSFSAAVIGRSTGPTRKTPPLKSAIWSFRVTGSIPARESSGVMLHLDLNSDLDEAERVIDAS